MIKISFLLNVVIVIFFAGMGLLESRRLLRHNPGGSLEVILKKTYYIYVTLPFMILLFILNLYLQKHTQIIWDFPIWLQYRLGKIVWVSTLVMIVFLFSLVASLAFNTRHKEKLKVIVSGVLFIVLLEAILWIYTNLFCSLITSGKKTMRLPLWDMKTTLLKFGIPCIKGKSFSPGKSSRADGAAAGLRLTCKTSE